MRIHLASSFHATGSDRSAPPQLPGEAEGRIDSLFWLVHSTAPVRRAGTPKLVVRPRWESGNRRAMLLSVAESRLRVVLAEDSYLVREGVRRLLETDPGLELASACSDMDSLLAAVERERPAVVVTDIRMPPSNTDEGIQAAALLRDTLPGVGVVVLSQHDEPEYVLKLLERGSARRAYLLKDSLNDPAHLVAAVREVAAGGSLIDPRVVEALVASRSRQRGSAMWELTVRELEVLSQMAQGCNNDTVATRLHLSVRMVEKHINSIFSKLSLSEESDVHRRVKAVLIYLSAASD